jgi:hypothetical protein
VIKAESDQIVVALRDRGFPVEYINAPDEGHGFARPENNMAFIAAMEKFLARHIGGRYQEDMPENIARRLEEITVDINTVTLPEELSSDETGSILVPVRELTTGTFDFDVSIEAMGMNMKSTTEISRDGDNYLITEITRTPMGDATDRMRLNAASLAPLSREMTQGTVNINVEYRENMVEGTLNTGTNEIPVSIALSGPLFAEGPGQTLLLATLPLTEGYTTVFRNSDVSTMTEKLFRINVKGETLEGGEKAWRMDIVAADGSPGSTTVWIEQDTYTVLQYEQSVPQLGGATIKGILGR